MVELSPLLILGIIALYFLLLVGISYLTGKDSGNANFFLAGRKSPWYLVAFGMIGATLSGVTFISVPGVVGAGKVNMNFSYMQMVFGYLVGYLIIALVLLPVYYRYNLTSIYGYLNQRFGFYSYKIGSGYFLLSRVVGASLRLYLVGLVLHQFVTAPLFGIPFWLTVLITIALIWVYTFRGGINTIVWTDTLQTTCMLAAVVLTIFAIGNDLDKNLGELITSVRQSEYAQMFFFKGGWSDPNNFFKQFISGVLIATVMTGLDQDMMQKNLSCKTLKESQTNVITFSVILIFAKFLFLALGALLYIYAANYGLEIPGRTDLLYPEIALNHLSPFIGIMFILGLIAAAYSSADSALTALTTSFCIDFLGFQEDHADEELAKQQKRTRLMVHIGFSVLLLIVINVFNAVNDTAVISKIFEWAGYTYGPLLGLFAFGIFTNLKINERWVIPVCIIAPVASYVLNVNNLFLNFQLGNLVILLNGLLTFFGLWAISHREE
ncbi:MAG: sodium:solute symporter [Bacteroidota bacterium]